MARVVLAALLLLTGCGDSAVTPGRWEGAVVVRICRDGSYIFRLRDGAYVDAYAHPIEDPEKVCGP